MHPCPHIICNCHRLKYVRLYWKYYFQLIYCSLHQFLDVQLYWLLITKSFRKGLYTAVNIMFWTSNGFNDRFECAFQIKWIVLELKEHIWFSSTTIQTTFPVDQTPIRLLLTIFQISRWNAIIYQNRILNEKYIQWNFHNRNKTVAAQMSQWESSRLQKKNLVPILYVQTSTVFYPEILSKLILV